MVAWGGVCNGREEPSVGRNFRVSNKRIRMNSAVVLELSLIGAGPIADEPTRSGSVTILRMEHLVVSGACHSRSPGMSNVHLVRRFK